MCQFNFVLQYGLGGRGEGGRDEGEGGREGRGKGGRREGGKGGRREGGKEGRREGKEILIEYLQSRAWLQFRSCQYLGINADACNRN